MAGDFNRIIDDLSTRFFSNTTSYGLEYCPAVVEHNDLATNNLEIRHFNLNDLNTLQEKSRHIRLVEENIPTCYIATNKDDNQVFRQWVFKHDQNHRIKAYFGFLFPKLGTNEALLEGGFTHPDHRGQRIMAKGILNILNLSENNDIKRFITFVDTSNIPSIKGLQRVGFTPYSIRHEQWRFFKRKVTFTPISAEAKNTYFKLSEKRSIKH